MKSNQSKRTSVIVDGKLENQLGVRTVHQRDTPRVIRNILDVHFALLWDARKQLAKVLSLDECRFIVDALKEVPLGWPQTLFPQIQAAIEQVPRGSNPAEIDTVQLLIRLKKMETITIVALIDAVQCWWLNHYGTKTNGDPETLFDF